MLFRSLKLLTKMSEESPKCKRTKKFQTLYQVDFIRTLKGLPPLVVPPAADPIERLPQTPSENDGVFSFLEELLTSSAVPEPTGAGASEQEGAVLGVRGQIQQQLNTEAEHKEDWSFLITDQAARGRSSPRLFPERSPSATSVCSMLHSDDRDYVPPSKP